MCEICCEFFIFQRNNVSTRWARTASVSMSPISDFWNGRHAHLFYQACGSSSQIWTQWIIKFAYKFSSGSVSEKCITWTDWQINKHSRMLTKPCNGKSCDEPGHSPQWVHRQDASVVGGDRTPSVQQAEAILTAAAATTTDHVVH